MRLRVFMMAALVVCAVLSMGGPIVSAGPRGPALEPVVRLRPDRFRCVLVGDSQTTGPNAERIRTQDHRWDAPIIGELVTVGNATTGFVVNNSNAGIPNLVYTPIGLDAGWPNGGPDDFFAPTGSQWTCLGDINATGSKIGRYRVRFGGGNTDAPWNEAWGIGHPLIARIAVRTSPMCVGAIETRADRGDVTEYASRTIHKLNKDWGVQIIEQPIPVGFNPFGDDVGIGIYFPSGSIEQPGQVLQILGVVIERVDDAGNRIDGTLIAYQGSGGWNMATHLDKISRASRIALVEMIDPDYIMVMLGHNSEPGGAASVSPNLKMLVKEWESVFLTLNRPRPGFIYVVPWAAGSESASPYLLEVESAMSSMASLRRTDRLVNYLPVFSYLRPDVYDPARYQLDGGHVHPLNIPSAVNLSQDLFELLFRGGT